MSAELLARARAVVAEDQQSAESNGAWSPDRVLQVCESRARLLDEYEALLTLIAANADGEPDADDEDALDEYGLMCAYARAEVAERWVQAVADEGGERG